MGGCDSLPAADELHHLLARNQALQNQVTAATADLRDQLRQLAGTQRIAGGRVVPQPRDLDARG